jgi:poly(beta-D-mannuronate) lyase
VATRSTSTGRLRRPVALAAVAVGALAVPVALAWPSLAATAPRTVTVSSVSALQTALSNAQPGDQVQVADGTYTTSAALKVTRSGTATAPITVTAQHVGKARFTGRGNFSFGTVGYVVISGFVFTDSGGFSTPVGAAHLRITRNVFQFSTGGNWVTIASDDTEVDHNTWQHKSSLGVFLQISGPGSNGMAQRTWIHHNYFFDHSYGGANGGESIRLGLSSRQHSSAHAIVEYNLFERANGDSEAISVKSSDNIVRYNTLRNSRGTISLRHGWRTLVDGNFVIGSTSGIRFFGNDHVIINNVVENSTGQALEIGGGEVRDDTTSGRNHEAVDRALVAFNTFVNDRSNPIQVGDGGKRYQPDTVTIANNIVVGTGTSTRVVGGTHLTWQGNILSGVTAGAMPASGYRSVNPKLVLDSAGLYRLSAGSPAIGAALGTYPQVVRDMDGQARPSAKDVGADQYANGGATHEPLTSADVGPLAP